MGMYTSPPFALFSVVNLPLETIDKALTFAKDGSTVDNWWWALISSESYDSAPHKPADGGGATGTTAPIGRSFKSPFVGKDVRATNEWLKAKPENVDVDPRFFGLLDKKAKELKVVLCRVGDRQGKGNDVQCVLVPAEESTLTLGGLQSGVWEDLVESKGAYTPEM